VSEERRLEARLTARPLAGKRALVTGGAKRIGRALALTLAEAGADVAITYRGSEAEALATVEAIQASGVRAFAQSCDVSPMRSPRSLKI
jgi:NAD(P)-dependent dehydrogenase (short-subunit alcohol dehydrogenase family)